MFDWDYKPGSVIDSHLSRRSVAAALKPPPRKRPGRPYASSTVLHRIEFTAPQCSHAAGELLPRLSTLTPRAGRYFSVALFLKSPSAGVTRYSCPVEPGLSSRTAFRPAPAAVQLACKLILPNSVFLVNKVFDDFPGNDETYNRGNKGGTARDLAALDAGAGGIRGANAIGMAAAGEIV